MTISKLYGRAGIGIRLTQPHATAIQPIYNRYPVPATLPFKRPARSLTWIKVHKAACHVGRFWEGERAERGVLLHIGRDPWEFTYAPGTEDDEPAFKFDKHVFVVGEYVSIS